MEAATVLREAVTLCKVTLLLRFTRELAIVMMLMFAFNAYAMADNQARH